MIKARYILLLSLVVIVIRTEAINEFNCEVSVTAPTVNAVDPAIFTSLRGDIFEFLNNQKWTNINFRVEERIECSVVITVREAVNIGRYRANLNLVLRRPVYKTNYNTILLNYVDEDFEFEYQPFQPLEFVPNTFTGNLTSVLAFYMYIFLGMDFDSFSPNGGTPYYMQAQTIVNTAQNTSFAGWQAFEGTRNRYWMVENLLNTTYSPLRTFLYEYHRLGLDIMSEETENGRGKIAETLQNLEKVDNERPALFMTTLLVDAKRDEIIEIFKEAPMVEKNKVTNTMREVDPANSSRYQEIIDN